MTEGNRIIVSVFGSSRPAPDEEEYVIAYELGRELAAAGFVVCNGGYGGIMEASARGAKDAGGHTIGIIMSSLGGRQANPWIDETIHEGSLIERMVKLISLGNAYVVLKGGTGTLLELAAVWEFMNKNLMQRKPFVVVGDFWNDVIGTLNDELAWEGNAQAAHFITVVHTPGECAEFLKKRLKVSSPNP